MASKYDIAIDQGTSMYRKLTWKSADNIPVNTVGYSAKMQIRVRIGGTIMQELSTTTGEILISTDGIIELKLTPAKTRNIKMSGVYDLVLTSPEGIVTRLLQGSIDLSPEVTE